MKKLYTAYGIIAAILFISGYWLYILPLSRIVIATLLVQFIVKHTVKESRTELNEKYTAQQPQPRQPKPGSAEDFERWKAERERQQQGE